MLTAARERGGQGPPPVRSPAGGGLATSAALPARSAGARRRPPAAAPLSAPRPAPAPPARPGPPDAAWLRPSPADPKGRAPRHPARPCANPPSYWMLRTGPQASPAAAAAPHQVLGPPLCTPGAKYYQVVKGPPRSRPLLRAPTCSNPRSRRSLSHWPAAAPTIGPRYLSVSWESSTPPGWRRPRPHWVCGAGWVDPER